MIDQQELIQTYLAQIETSQYNLARHKLLLEAAQRRLLVAERRVQAVQSAVGRELLVIRGLQEAMHAQSAITVQESTGGRS